jgi:endothelin-converting enzyme
VVCSGFTEHNDDDTGTTGIIQKRNNRILRNILESSSHKQAAGLRSTLLGRSTIDEHNFDMLRAGYQSCMDTAAAAVAGVEPLNDLIISINKTWPASPNDLKTKVTPSEYNGLAKASLLVEQLNVQVFRSIADDMPVVADPLNSVRGTCVPLDTSIY